MVLAGEISRGAVRLRHDERGVVIQLTDKTLFDSGSAVIREDAKPILSRVATLLKSIPNQIRIEGHTDNRPIRTARYPSNWELSVARATNVLRYLEEVHGISPGRLSASGYGEWRPLRPNTTEGNRALNRRVDIIVLREEVAALEPAID
jgi:chemotaxis protein MotB